MARPKKYAESESFGVRFPVDLLSQLSAYANARQKTRSEVVVNAVSHYVHSKQCVLCGAINPEEGNHCAVCGAELFPYDDVKAAVTEITNSKIAVFRGEKSHAIPECLNNAEFEPVYRFVMYPCDKSEIDIMKYNFIWLATMRLRIKGTKFWISSDEDPTEWVFKIHPEYLYAKLKDDTETMGKLQHSRAVVITVFSE